MLRVLLLARGKYVRREEGNKKSNRPEGDATSRWSAFLAVEGKR